MSTKWEHRDGYGNVKFPFLELCVTLELRIEIYIAAKRKMRQI